jgi:cell fate regulator YaaT (PSP1 superfamily)
MRYRHFKYLVMLFRLTNVLAICIRLINNALAECLDIFAIVYLDDILVYSLNKESYKAHVRIVLAQLKKYNLQLKLEKCEFYTKEIKFLRFRVSPKGIAIS